MHGTHTEACTKRSEDNLNESVLSFYHGGSREGTQDERFDGKHLHTLSNPISSAWSLLMHLHALSNPISSAWSLLMHILMHITILMLALYQT